MATKTTVTFKNTEAALMNVRGASPKAESDFATKAYVDNQTHGMFIINLTEDTNNKTYTADQDYTAIKAAYDNKQNLAIRLNTSSNAQFPLVNVEFSANGDAGFTFGYTEMQSGEQLVVTRSILYSHTSDSDTWEDNDKTGYFLALNNNESSSDYGAVTTNINMASNSILNAQKIHINGEAPFYIGKVIETQDPNKPRLTGVAGTNEAAFVKSDKQAEYVPVFVDTPTKNNHASTKKYVDDAVSAKLNKITDTANDDRVYGVTADGQQKMYSISSAVTADALATRTDTGALLVAEEPTNDSEAVSKKYVDIKTAALFSYDSDTKTLTINA